MHIVVCVKAVPSSTEVKMDPVTHTIVRDGRESVVNPFDAAALEVALAIKDERAAAGEGCRVSVLSMGIPATEALLRDGIARGASDALLLSDRAFAGADTLATSYALSCGIRELGSAGMGDAAAPGASEQRAAAPGSAAPGTPEGGTAMPGSAVSGAPEHGEAAPRPLSSRPHPLRQDGGRWRHGTDRAGTRRALRYALRHGCARAGRD